MTIAPDAGLAEQAVFDIEITGLQPDSPYAIEILFENEVVFKSDEVSDADGRIAYPISSTEGDEPGIYTLQVRVDDTVVASADFELTAAAADEPTTESELVGEVTVTPETAPFGSVQEIRASGLETQTNYTLEIIASETQTVGYRRVHTSDDDGLIQIEIFAEEGDVPGLHAIAIYDEAGELIAAGDFTIDAPAERQAQVELLPATIHAGGSIDIAVTGLQAFDSVTAQITSAAGVLIDTDLARASSDGAVTLTFSADEDLAPGEYAVDIFVEAEKLASAALQVSPPPAPVQATEEAPVEEPATAVDPETEDNASATIEPGAAPIGSSHVITVSGLDARETVTFEVMFAGESVYRTQKTANASGETSIELVTDADDQPGDYIVTVLRDAGNQPSVVLTATAKEAVEYVTTTVGDAEIIESRLFDGVAEYDFQGEAGKVVLLSVASSDFDPAFGLINRDGLQIAFNDDSRGQKDAIIGPLTLPYSGRYTLEITAQPLMMAQGAIDGDFVITIADVRLAPLAFDAATPFALSADAPARYFTLPVETGDSLTVTVDSGGGLDTVLQVAAPNGGEFAFDDDSGSGFDAELSNLIFDHAATYVLVVSSFDSGASGQGTVRVRRNPVHNLERGETLISLNDKALRDLVVFDAEEDEYLILNLERLSGDVEDLYVTATVEGMEVMSYSTMGVPDALPLAFVMPMSGRVVVTLEKFGFDDGISLEVSLSRP